ncbi:hypothetical protein JCM13664_06540 [Methylothermus subterraneus]
MKTTLGECAVVLLSILLFGCSSIRARTDTSLTDWTVYPGVRQDVKDMAQILGGRRPEPFWVKGLATGILIVDLPASAVFDTLAMPYDLYQIYLPKAQAD